MWARELGDLMDVLPYYLLVALPVFIILSPINPCDAASELDVHRLAQFELAGNTHGSKHAALTMDARGPTAAHVLRKTVVARMTELSVSGFRELVSGGAGGLLLLLPAGLGAGLGQEAREVVLALEEELTTAELDIPVYFAEETEELLELHATLTSEGEGSEAANSALAALLQSVSNSGYQLVVSAGTPQAVKEQGIVSMAGSLSSSGSEDSPPSILVVAHYDAGGAAPSLAMGADSNGSGVSMLLELARLLSSLYSSSRSHPAHAITFLLSGGGKLNYAGTKRWLEEHLDMDTTSDLLANVDFVLCLDSVGGSSPLKLHVSKPPKEGSAGEALLRNLNSVAAALAGEGERPGEVEVVHKKINLADDSLAWEHERFSIRRLPAFTLSAHARPLTAEHATVLDRAVSPAKLAANTRLVAEALACSLYPQLAEGGCKGSLFTGSLEPTAASLAGWQELVTAAPRHPSLLVGKHSEVVKALTAALARYTHEVTKVVSTPDRREPEYLLYDTPTAVMNVYRVKPAVFDLFLSAAIGCYLGFLYLLLNNSTTILVFLSALVKDKEGEQANGHAKTNGHYKNGGAVRNGSSTKLHAL